MSPFSHRYLSLMLVIALVSALLTVSGCAPDPPGDAGPDPADEDVVLGGTLLFPVWDELDSVDPLYLDDAEAIQVAQALYDSLVAFDPLTSEVVPAAAASWASNDDATVWTFDLVEGATFHNGREVTAQDFKWAWERLCDPENESTVAYHLAAVQGYAEMIEEGAEDLSGVIALDESTLQVTLERSFADFEYVVGHPALAPVPAEEASSDGFADLPVGNGPFKMSEPWAHGQYIKLEAFDGYHGDAPRIDGIEFRMLADVDESYIEFRAGTLDFAMIPPGQVGDAVEQYGESPDGYTANPGEQVLLGTDLGSYFLFVNTTVDGLDDPDVRRALSLAIDRESISSTVFEDTFEPAAGIVPPGIHGYQENGFPYADHDPERARELLAEAGYPDGEGLGVIKLEYNTGQGHEDVLTLVKRDLAEIGVESELVGFEGMRYREMLGGMEHQVARYGWGSDYPIMESMLEPLFRTGMPNNYAGYSDSEVDAKLEEARATVDDAERVELYREIERMIGESVPAIPIAFYRHTRVASDRVMDGVFSPMGLFDFTRVWLTE